MPESPYSASPPADPASISRLIGLAKLYLNTNFSTLKMNLPSVVLVSLLAITNALPAPDTVISLAVREPDTAKAKYSCQIAVYDQANWVGRHKVFNFAFEERVRQQCGMRFVQLPY